MKVSDGNKNFTAINSDCLNGFSVVKTFRAEGAILGLFSKENDKLETCKYKRTRIRIFIDTLSQLSGMSAQLTVFFAGTYLALSGKGLTAGNVMMFVNLMNFVVAPVAELPGLLAGRKAADALIRKVSDALEKSSYTGGDKDLSKLSKSISLKNVSFSYEEGKEILHDISVDFEAGKSYAIVGTHSLDEKLMKKYDRILVMKNGRIEEQGTFDELMAGRKYFHALFTVEV